MMNADFTEYVDNENKLKDICKYIKKNVSIIGIDTEFIRRHTYYPMLCLIQVIYFNKEINNYKIALIDAIKIKNLSNFLVLLRSKKLKKIIFSFSQDIDAFYFLMGKNKINNIDDLQVMMEFCGYNQNIGYDECVKRVLDIQFKKDKTLQNSNWKKRPLTKKQLEYGANDVLYLIPIYNHLVELLKKYNNYDNYIDEINHLIKFKDKKYLINNSWKKLKFDLHKKNLNYVLLVKELCKWREEKAIIENKIRNFILDDNILEKIALDKPTTIKELKLLYTSNLSLTNTKKQYKAEILEIVNNFIKNYNDLYKDDIFYTCERGFIYKDLLKDIYQKIEFISNQSHISINRTISKMDIIFLIMKYEKKSSILYGWKYKLFKHIFNNNIKKY